MTPFDELWIDFLLIVVLLCWTVSHAVVSALIATPPMYMTWLIAKHAGWQRAALFLAIFLFAAYRVHALTSSNACCGDHRPHDDLLSFVLKELHYV